MRKNSNPDIIQGSNELMDQNRNLNKHEVKRQIVRQLGPEFIDYFWTFLLWGLFDSFTKRIYSIDLLIYTRRCYCRHAICHKLNTDKISDYFFYPKKCFLGKQRKLYFHILNIYTQGYITFKKYIIGIASIGLLKENLWATKCVTKRP